MLPQRPFAGRKESNESADPTQLLAKAADTATRTTAGHVRAADERRR